MTTVVVGAALFVPWRRLPSYLQAGPPFAYFLVIALLREAEGGAVSGYGALVLLPLFWIALYGTRWQLIVALLLMFLTLAAPIVIEGAPVVSTGRMASGVRVVDRGAPDGLHRSNAG